MKTLIKFLTIPLFLFILSFLLPQKVHLEHQLVINAPASSIFNNVTNLRNWGKWSGILPVNSKIELTEIHDESGNHTGYNWEYPDQTDLKRQLIITWPVPSKLVALSFDFMKDRKANSLFRFEEKTNLP